MVYVSTYISDRIEHFRKKYDFIVKEDRLLEKILESLRHTMNRTLRACQGD